MKSLEKVEKQPHIYYPVFTVFSDIEGRFLIIQKAEFKNYEILSLDFRKSSDVKV